MALKTVSGFITSSSVVEIAPAVSGKVLKVKFLEYGLVNEADAPINVNLQDDAATPVVLTPAQALNAGAPHRFRMHNAYACKSTQSKNLGLLCSAAKKIYYKCVYEDGDAS